MERHGKVYSLFPFPKKQKHRYLLSLCLRYIVIVNQDHEDHQMSEKQPSTKKESDTAAHKLKEREKELNCIYSLSEIIEDESLTTEEKLQKIVTILPPAWQYPEHTCARIILKDKEYTTENFKETPWKISKDLKAKGTIVGSLQVFYTEEKPREDYGPFLNQELKLSNVLAERIGSFIENIDLSHELNINHTPGKSDWRIIIDMLVKTDPSLLFRVTRKMLYQLSRVHSDGLIDLMNNISCPIGPDAKPSEWCGINMPNPKQDMQTLQRIQENVFMLAEQHLPPEQITRLLEQWLRQDKARPLILAAENSGISLVEIKDVINKISEAPITELPLSYEDNISIVTNLLRRFFTDRLQYINIAKQYVTIEDFISLIKNVIGPSRGSGKLGGKTSGIYLAEKILQKERNKLDDKDLNTISFARSWYVTSDTMWDIIRYNDLDEAIHTKYMDPKDIKAEQPFLEQVFKNAAFPSEIVESLRRVLQELGDKPIIVRSSSLLEDSFEAAFSGKYKSLFLANSGNEEERLANLMDAIAEVYASTFSPDPIEYRRERGLLDFTEGMGILIQEVVGKRIGPYYFPVFAGVAFRNNEFRWSPRIQRSDGIVRLVTGLGTRAVDRVAGDYPVLVSPRRPNIQVNAMVDETIRYSQRYMDVINVEKGLPETLPVEDILPQHGSKIPILNQIVSVHKEGHLSRPTGIILNPEDADMVVTFSGLLEQGRFIKQIEWVLSTLSEHMDTPVDVEFASDGEHLYILQCRPQSQGKITHRVTIPKTMLKNRIFFTAHKYVTNGQLDNITHIVYVDPQGYDQLEKREDMMAVAEIVSHLNDTLAKRQFILMGPGRWGSRGDIKLGVPVQYRDINNTSLLIEIAQKKKGDMPDLSFGTHFFQDLVEADIHYLPLYPDSSDVFFNTTLLDIAPNKLPDLLPKYKQLASVVKVIAVADIANGGTLSVAMDGESNKAMAFLVPTEHWVWRMNKVEELAQKLNPDRYGVIAMYVFGSTQEGTAGPFSDIDLLIHQRGTEDQREDLLAWFREQEEDIIKEYKQRTGKKADELLDVHIITDEDIKENSSWAAHLNSISGSIKKIPLDSQED